MGKYEREEAARREGMAYALNVAKVRGLDGLEEELKYRNATRLPLGLDRAACDEAVNVIKTHVIEMMILLMSSTIHDEFGFGEKRIQRALDRLQEKAACLDEGYLTWQDLADQLKDELNIELK